MSSKRGKSPTRSYRATCAIIVFFGPEIFPLLEAYCATAMICDRIAAQLRKLDEIDHEAYESYDRMTRSLADLAKALCLLPEGERTDA